MEEHLMTTPAMEEILQKSGNSVQVVNDEVRVVDPIRLRENIETLVRASVFGQGSEPALARYLIRAAANVLGTFPGSIQELYAARGRGEIPPIFTVPAMNLRALSYQAARAVFRAANSLDVGAMIFEIARSEIGYTDQRPAEYATNIIGAAIAEGYQGPVFIQGDHFQVSAKRYASGSEDEIAAVATLTEEAIKAGFYNIDIDTSTLVDLSKSTIEDQQALNSTLSAQFTRLIRSLEPDGVTVSIGGEIGEVGGQNSTEAELRGYMETFNASLEGETGLSKISIQTGTSHGGVVLPDGSIAEVNVDFDTLYRLSRVARNEYKLAGAVQHGASTLPEDAFGRFADSEACEVHLATNFQTMMYERIPDELRLEMYSYLNKNHSGDRKAGWTNEQFYYKTQKYAVGPFKSELWNLEEESLREITTAWEEKFRKLFGLLRVADTRKYVEQTITKVAVPVSEKMFKDEGLSGESTSDLAD
jgi:fructose-bisphosphate aldolase, class II